MEEQNKVAEELKREETPESTEGQQVETDKKTNEDTQAYAEGARKGAKKALDELYAQLGVKDLDELKAKLSPSDVTSDTSTEQIAKTEPKESDSKESNGKDDNLISSENINESNVVSESDDLAQKLAALEKENASLKAEKIAISLVSKNYSEDLVALCLGRGLEPNAENLKTIADSHPEWKDNAVVNHTQMGTTTGTKGAPQDEDGEAYARRLLHI